MIQDGDNPELTYDARFTVMDGKYIERSVEKTETDTKYDTLTVSVVLDTFTTWYCKGIILTCIRTIRN